MTLLEINTQFKAVTDAITGLNGYSFGYLSDRTRSQLYDDPGEDQTDLYPRVFFGVPEITSNLVGKNDLYECTVIFDDLQGYNDDGDTVTLTQVEQWEVLRGLASKWMNEMQKNVRTGVISSEVRYKFNSFGGTQRLISVIASFTFVTKSVC